MQIVNQQAARHLVTRDPESFQPLGRFLDASTSSAIIMRSKMCRDGMSFAMTDYQPNYNWHRTQIDGSDPPREGHRRLLLVTGICQACQSRDRTILGDEYAGDDAAHELLTFGTPKNGPLRATRL